MTDFKIRRGLSTDLFINGDNKAGIIDGVVLENGCWYLCTDTADLFLCVQQTNGLTLKRINEKAGWDITIDGDTIDASVIIALRAEVNNIKESLNDYATKQYVVDAIDKHEALATIEEVKTKLETEVLPTVQETILPTVQKVETEILPTVQELVEKTATQEWVNAQLNIIENNIGYVATNDKSFAEVIDETFAKKSEVPSINGLATETFVHEMIAKAELEDKEADLEAYYTKDQVDALIPSLDGYAKTEDIPTDYVKASDLEGYSKFSGSYNDLTDRPEIPSIEGLAAEEYVDKAIANIPETDLSNYYNKSETETLVNEAVSGIDLPDVSDFITIKDVEAKGYLVAEDISGKANKEHTHTEYAASEHTHDQYLTEQSLSVYAKQSDLFSRDYKDLTNKPDLFSGDYEDLTNKPAIPEAYNDTELRNLINGKADSVHSHDNYADKEHTHSQYLVADDIASKANDVPFTTDKFVTTAFGGFAKGEPVKGLSIVEILTKLLGLADEAPSEDPDTPPTSGNVTIEDVKQYSIPVMQGAVKNGEVTIENTASAFSYLELTEAVAEKAPQEAEPGTALLYEIKDNSDNVIEAGYQIYTIASGRGTKYRVALAEGLTFTKIEMFDDGTKSWVPYDLTFTETGDRLTHDGYSYVVYESSSSSNCEILRVILE